MQYSILLLAAVLLGTAYAQKGGGFPQNIAQRKSPARAIAAKAPPLPPPRPRPAPPAPVQAPFQQVQQVCIMR